MRKRDYGNCGANNMRGKIKKEGLGVLVYSGYCGANHMMGYLILFML
jgi:hypothetical protein